MYNVGKSKYVVNFCDGVKKHSDGSRFYDIRIFKNKKMFEAFILSLINTGYQERAHF
jgi:hypothetical protein